MKTQEVKSKIEQLPKMANLKPEDYAGRCGWAESVVKDQGSKLKATQLRKIFHYVKSLKREFKDQGNFNRAKVVLIMPTLAYAVGRNLITEEFYELLTTMLNKCQTSQDFESVANFLEAIMAYHKYHDKQA
ncbi:MAG: type III-A CRISPR-associated protein Csm2 [Anaerolineales bacterium]